MENENSRFSRRDFARTAALGAGALSAIGLTGAEKPAADIKLGLYSITYLGVWYGGDALTLEQVVQRAKQFGYHGVEIDGKRPHGNPLDMPRKRCKDLQKFAKDQGVELYAVAGNNDFSSPMPEFREAQILYMRELIRMTADLDVKILRVFLAWPGVTLRPEGGARYDLAQQAWKDTHKEFSPERIWDWCRDGLKESVKYASDAGVTLALQNHPPVIKGYGDMLKMIKEISSPNLKACFDARLEHEMNAEDVVRASKEVGPLQVLSHYGNEYKEQDGKIVLNEDELIDAQVAGLLEIGYRGYLGFELCHPMPIIDGKLAGIGYADQNARLAAISLRDTIAKVKKQKGLA